jgi:hypothetical protein
VAPKDGGPLQEELVCVGWHLWDAWLVHIRVLQADALELREPDREVWRVGFGIADARVEGLRIIEEEPRRETAAQARLQVAV